MITKVDFEKAIEINDQIRWNTQTLRNLKKFDENGLDTVQHVNIDVRVVGFLGMNDCYFQLTKEHLNLDSMKVFVKEVILRLENKVEHLQYELNKIVK